MYIVAGLGNPGTQYAGTRHNAGFSCIDELADKYNISVDTAKHKGLIGKGVIEGEKVLLVKPMTYMNNSGECIREVMDYYKADIDDLIVICHVPAARVANGERNILKASARCCFFQKNMRCNRRCSAVKQHQHIDRLINSVPPKQ